MVVKVLVKLKRNESLSWDGQQIVASINASPIKGAANIRLESALADWLDLPKSSVSIQKGRTSRHKSIKIELDDEELKGALDTLPRHPKQMKLL